jgi:hypothetical protein
MKYLNLFEEFNFDIEPLDVHGKNLEVTIDDEDLSFKVIDGEVSFSSEDDYERAFELGVEIDDELKSYILDEYKKMSDKTRMKRFGFFKESIVRKKINKNIQNFYDDIANDCELTLIDLVDDGRFYVIENYFEDIVIAIRKISNGKIRWVDVQESLIPFIKLMSKKHDISVELLNKNSDKVISDNIEDILAGKHIRFSSLHLTIQKKYDYNLHRHRINFRD